MVLGEFKEILFWNDMEKLLGEEKRLRDRYQPNDKPENRQLYCQEMTVFIQREIPTRAHFWKRISEYEVVRYQSDDFRRFVRRL